MNATGGSFPLFGDDSSGISFWVGGGACPAGSPAEGWGDAVAVAGDGGGDGFRGGVVGVGDAGDDEALGADGHTRTEAPRVYPCHATDNRVRGTDATVDSGKGGQELGTVRQRDVAVGIYLQDGSAALGMGITVGRVVELLCRQTENPVAMGEVGVVIHDGTTQLANGRCGGQREFLAEPDVGTQPTVGRLDNLNRGQTAH